MAGRHPIVVRTVKTSRGDIDYCVYDFIKEMEKKPVIWNRMHIDSKNSAIVEKNWKSFAGTIVPFMEELDEDEQSLIIEEFKNRWCYLRTELRASILTVKKGTSKPCHYLRLMEFFLNSKNQYLKDILSEEEIEKLRENEIKWRTEAGFPPTENVENKRSLPIEDYVEHKNKATKRKNPVEEASPNKRSARLREKCINKLETKVTTNKNSQIKNTLPLKQLQSLKNKARKTQPTHNPKQSLGNISFDPISLYETTSQPSLDDVSIQAEAQFDYRQQQQCNNIRIQNYATNNSNTGNSKDLQDKAYDAHQAFFDSIKPTLRKLNDTQKLDFKIDVLKTLKKYKLY